MTIFSNSVRPAAILSRIFPLLCILFAAPVFPQGLQPPPHRSSLPLIYGPQTFDWATDRGDYQITVRVYDNDSRVPNTYLWDYEVANGSFMPRYYEDDFVGLPFLEIALEASFVD